jgi:heparin/heparan-sulfate lyase
MAMHSAGGFGGVGAALAALTMASVRLSAAAPAQPATGPGPAGPQVFEAEAARLDPERVEIVEQKTFPSGKGVALRAGLASATGSPDTLPDLVFTVKAPRAGRYWLRTHAATDARGTETMRQATGKGASLRLAISVAGSRPVRRVVFVPWSPPGSCTQALGRFDLSGQEQEVRVWLPEGVRLDYLQVAPYVPPRVPDAAASYQPKVVPPPSRPRVWVNAESLPRVRANLTRGENAPLWAKVQEQAAKPFEFAPQPEAEVTHNAALESAAVAKAFVFLMTGERERGTEAVGLIRRYIPAVEFDNLLDITREIGRAIYSGALVYDWCYELLTPADREAIRAGLMRLAEDMEIGWPPFLQTIVNGHGNEAQVNRDLLSMGIAIYDEDPVPYRYCAYRILEELVPMRAFEYQSPRHNQGISYGPYRFAWDLHAAWLFRRLTGQPVFDPNIGDVYRFWLYMRLPNGRMLRDGDGFSDGGPANLGATPLLSYAYTADPIVKGDFERQGGLPGDPILVLLLNDPDLTAQKGLETLPLTLDFGPVLGGMVARTGWNLGRNQADVVVEMKGGGFHFGNHQHADAGSFQIYYRGYQAVDLGQYRFYGTPYDTNFCKRSVPHCMLLAVDPEEKFPGTSSNDGGARFVRSCPITPEQTRTDPLFANGTVVAADFGPSRQRPFFSLFAVDLKSAYGPKIATYVRTFCFLNLDTPATPAALIVLDALTTARPDVRTYWQTNTLNPPEVTAEGVVLQSRDLGLGGRVRVRLLRPAAAERELQVLSGAEANSVFGQAFTPPFPERPEANGHRVMFSPTVAQTSDVFLAVMTMEAEGTPELPVAMAETPEVFVVTLADRVATFGKTEKLLEDGFGVEVPAGQERQVLLTGLRPGPWSVQSEDGAVRLNVQVEAGRNTAFVVAQGSRLSVRPEALPGAPAYQAPPELMPALSPPLLNRVVVDGQVLEGPPVRAGTPCLLVPALAVLRALAVEAAEEGDRLRVSAGDRAATFGKSDSHFTLNGLRCRLPVSIQCDQGEWFIPDSVLAWITGRDLVRDAASTGVDLARGQANLLPEVLWAEASDNSDPLALRALLTDLPGRPEYWAIQGQDVGFDLALAKPLALNGVAIRWHQGAARQARFAIDTSADGTDWQRVFEGTSSGTTAELEAYAFAVRTIRFVRFRGFGNTQNSWNSLVHFRVLHDRPGKAE